MRVHLSCLLAILCLLTGHTKCLTESELAVFDHYNVTITDGGDNKYRIQASGLPFYNFVAADGIEAQEKNYDFMVYKTPMVLDAPGCLPMGMIAMAVDGSAIFNPYSGAFQNAVVEEAATFDMCNAHADPMAYAFHFHVLPTYESTCLTSDAFTYQNADTEALFGLSLDGYPIYTLMNGSTPAGLDACNGKEVGGAYRYYATTEFPYFQGCYKAYVYVDDDDDDDDDDEGGDEGGDMMPPPEGDNMPPPPEGDDGVMMDMMSASGSSCVFAYVSNPNGIDDLTTGIFNNDQDISSSPSLFTFYTTALLMIGLAITHGMQVYQ